MMTKVTIQSGICGYTVTVTVNRLEKRTFAVELDTECRMVKAMLEDIPTLDMMAVFSGYLSNPVYRSATRHLKHVACPVPGGILKAIEVEAGMCLPKDVSIVFSK